MARMGTSPLLPSPTVREAIAAALGALDSARPDGGDRMFARAQLERAIELLDASYREAGTFGDAEPYRLVLDPRPQEAPKLVLVQPPV
jgi:hypothetical protein